MLLSFYLRSSDNNYACKHYGCQRLLVKVVRELGLMGGYRSGSPQLKAETERGLRTMGILRLARTQPAAM